jgi:uncharacterized protein with von Willebrand factor type A (vWA) domain
MATITAEPPLHSTDVPASMVLDLPAFASVLSRHLRDGGMSVTTAQAEQYALSLELVEPSSGHALYWTTRAVFVTSHQQLPTFDRVFRDVFGSDFIAGSARSHGDPVQRVLPRALGREARPKKSCAAAADERPFSGPPLAGAVAPVSGRGIGGSLPGTPTMR